MPRISRKARLKQRWFRLKRWCRTKFGPKPTILFGSLCPDCGGVVSYKVERRVVGKTVIVATGFACEKCGWQPPPEPNPTERPKRDS